MRVAISLSLLLAACSAPEEPAANQPATPTEVEALPADESAETTSEELANGVNDPDIEDLGNQH